MNGSSYSPTHWHHLPIEEVLKQLETSTSGLSGDQARQRLSRAGENRLPSPKRRGPLMRLLLQFHNVLIYVLLLAAGLTAIIGDWVDTIVILGVVIVNALIGFIQEGKAEMAVDAIRKMLSFHAVVRRDGQHHEIPAEQVVPGDVVFLQAGDKVPADLRLFDVKNLRVDEAVLTGESEAVEKAATPAAPDAAIGDRLCMTFSGTLVTYGQAMGVVVATGSATELGRISTLLATVEVLSTPLLRQIAGLARRLAVTIIAISALTFAFGWWFRDFATVELLLAVVGLAVAAIPEGLPAIMTITLAIGVQRMARRNAIIRHLPAVETLGSVTVICTDKTGTLTKNEMTVNRIVTAAHEFTVSGSGYRPHGGFVLQEHEISPDAFPDLIEIARASLLCNDATLQREGDDWVLTGDPTEGALLSLGLKAGLDRHREQMTLPRVDVIPFESQHRFMATLHHDHAGHGFIYLKGAPERVLEICAAQRKNGADEHIDLGYWRRQIEHLAAAGQRVLAIAFKPATAGQRELTFDNAADSFALLGLCGIIDPPREEAMRAIAQCRAAGIRVKMITGDHVVTAQAIGAQLGMGDGNLIVTGAPLETMSDEAMVELAAKTDVFARASPEYKLRLVQALQRGGEIVAMTGDGVNDAPALKRADVGIAMGLKGTEVAKEAAEVVLADDNFASIAAAVEDGRTVYDNLRKSILFLLPTNGGQATVIMAAILFGLTLPLTPLQVLWVNMSTAVTLALALAFEPTESSIMQRPPRDPKEPLLSAFLVWRIVFVSVLLLSGSLGLFLWETSQGASVEAGRTVAVNALMVGQAFYLFNSRFIMEPSFTRAGLLGSPHVLSAIAAMLVLQVFFTYAPFMQESFGTASIEWDAWLRIIAFGAIVFVAVEFEKSITRRSIRLTR